MSAFVMSDEYPKLCKAIEILGTILYRRIKFYNLIYPSSGTLICKC